MAIKVKHEMNAAPAAAATLAAGRARRSMETARMFASGSGSGGRGGGTTGAHASAISPGGAQAHVVGAHAPGVTDWEGTRRENAAQEAARLKQAIDVANVNNAAAKERAQMGIDADVEKLKNTQEFTKSQTEAEHAWREKQEKDKREAAQNEWDRQHGILRQERDADLIAAGTHEYGYSPEVQREYDKLMENYNRGLSEGRYTADSPEGRQFKAELDRQIAALPKTLVQREDPEGLFRNNTFTDAQGRIFTTDGKMVYNPADAETRRMEFQQRQMDADEKRYMDAVMRLQQGYRTAEPVYKMDEFGEKPLIDASGNPIVEKWNSVYKPYTPEQQEAILRRLFPNRFADIPQPSAPTAQPAPQPTAQPAPTTAAPTSPAPTPAAQPAPAAAAEPPASAAKRTTQPGGAVDWKELWK